MEAKQQKDAEKEEKAKQKQLEKEETDKAEKKQELGDMSNFVTQGKKALAEDPDCPLAKAYSHYKDNFM